MTVLKLNFSMNMLFKLGKLTCRPNIRQVYHGGLSFTEYNNLEDLQFDSSSSTLTLRSDSFLSVLSFGSSSNCRKKALFRNIMIMFTVDYDYKIIQKSYEILPFIFFVITIDVMK